MENREKQLIPFFRDYEKRFEQGLAGDINIEENTAAFAHYFVGASPAGIAGSKNDESFSTSLPEGFEFYKSVGTVSIKIDTIHVTELDDLHCMTRIHWVSLNTRKDGVTVTIPFEVIYFTQHLNNQIKIFAFITGDEKKALRENGLLQ